VPRRATALKAVTAAQSPGSVVPIVEQVVAFRRGRRRAIADAGERRLAAVEVEFFATADEFEAWLEANGADADEVLVRMAKKHTGVASLDWAGAVDVALCFGWIDGRSKRIDDDWFVQRFTPRRPQSTWSKVNRQKVEALIAAGRMRPAGLAEIERAKADGRWEAAYDGMATSAVPEDLAAALEAAGLTDAFAELSRQNRYAILHRVQTAKKAETRERRIAKYVGMLAAGETPY
jgi:uncharacterized protein YdeI (YjbR/CyaY-like superfamily)